MLINYDVEDRRKSKMKSDDRILFLAPMKDKPSLAADGSVDKRLFTGENKLHAIYDEMKGMWSMKYEMGGLPGGLQNQFTLFGELVAHARQYFKKRNIEIVEIKE